MIVKDKLYRTVWEFDAWVLRVVDADTIDLAIDLGFRVGTEQRIRLSRIDAYEVRGEEREKGLKAKARVEELLPVGAHVVLATKQESGGFGRWAGEILFDDGSAGLKNLNNLLLDEGHAVPYSR